VGVQNYSGYLKHKHERSERHKKQISRSCSWSSAENSPVCVKIIPLKFPCRELEKSFLVNASCVILPSLPSCTNMCVIHYVKFLQEKEESNHSRSNLCKLKGQTQCRRLPHEWGLGKGKTEASLPPAKSAKRLLRTRDLVTQ